MQSTKIRMVINALLVLIFMLTLSEQVSSAIVFRDSHTGQSEIYVMNDDGKNVRQLTQTLLPEYDPSWSPDGKYILFRRNLGPTEKKPLAQQFDIFIMDADGSNERRLTSHPQNDTSPCWSPDGKQIAFTGIRDGLPNIHIMELATGNIRQLTKNEDRKAYASSPSWSPDGKHIVHEQVIRGGGRHIYITDIDGKNTRPFLKGPQPHFVGDTVISRNHPHWSPDGKHVMYFEDHKRYEANRVVRLANHLIVVDKNGRNPKKLDIPKSWWLYSACWTAHGNQVLFAGEKNGFHNDGKRNYEIYRYHIFNSNITQITDTPHKEYQPHWVPGTLSVSPEGKLNVQWGEVKEEK